MTESGQQKKKKSESAEKADSLSKSEIRNVINAKRKSRGRGRTDAETAEAYAEYDKRKKFVWELEKRNYDYLCLFLASDGVLDEEGHSTEHDKSNYYIMGGNSAAIYVSEIGIAIGRTPRMRPDVDNTTKTFRGGYTMIKGLESFTKALKGIGIERAATKKNTDEVVLFKLKRQYTKEEIEGMKKNQKILREQANALLYGEILHPSLHKPIITMRTQIIRKLKNTKYEYRLMLERDFIKLLMDLKDYYILMLRGTINEREALVKMRLVVDKICDRIGMMQEMELWDVLFCIKQGDYAARIQREISALINAYDNREKKVQKEKKEKKKEDHKSETDAKK